MSAVPTKPGFYWAKWMIVDDGVPEGNTPFKTWEPVEVYLRDTNEGPDELRAWVIGHTFSQGLDCFHWGEELAPPADRAAALKRDARDEEGARALARYKKMTVDDRMAFVRQKKET